MIGLTIFLALPFAMIWSGFVLSYLWLWFIVPVFNAPPLSIPFAIGFSLVFGFINNSIKNKDDDLSDESIIKALLSDSFKPAIYLLIGYIVKGFI